VSQQFNPFDRDAPPPAEYLDIESGFAEFEALASRLDHQYAATDPAPLESHAEGTPVDLGSSSAGSPMAELVWPGAPANQQASTDSAASVSRVTLPEALVMFRQRRIAPLPSHWDELIAITGRGAPRPDDVPDATTLARQTKVARRLSLRALLTWADKRGTLDQLVRQLHSIPHESWTLISDFGP
jgi:hypothetical protein